MKRKLSALIVALILVLSCSVNAFAATKISRSDAISKALKNASLTKTQVVGLEAEYDDGVYEVEFTKRSNGVEYSFEYSSSGTLLKKSVDFNRAPVYGAKTLTKAQARAKVASFGGFKSSTVANGTVRLDSDDGQSIYEVSFNGSTYHFEYDVHARTGKILEWTKERLQKSTASNITSKALENAGVTKSQVVGLETSFDDGVYEVEFTKRSNGAEYSFEYSRSGKLLEKSVDYNRAPVYGAKTLTKAQARAKVASFGGFKASTVANGTVRLDSDDGQAIYEVSFNGSTYHFEYDVHARTGKILEWSKEILYR